MSSIRDLNLGRVWRGWSLWVRWLLVAVVCMLTVLGPMALMARPVHAQSPYEDVLPEVQLLRQQAEETLAQYQSFDAKGRAIIDANMAASMQEAIQHVYSSLPASERAELEEEMRRLTGYSFVQQVQMASTVPGYVKIINLIADGLQNLISRTKPPDEKDRAGGDEEIVPPPPPPPPSPGKVAVLRDLSGEVYVQKPGEREWTRAIEGTTITPGDWVKTGEDSEVFIHYPDGSWFQIRSNSMYLLQRFRDEEVNEQGTLIDLAKGKIKASIKRPKGRETWRFKTPTFVIRIRGTELIINVDEDGTSTVAVLEGMVEVRDITSGSIVSLKAFQMITVPKIPGGLERQDMLERVVDTTPELIERWWEEELPPRPVPSLAAGELVIAIVTGILVIALVPTLLLRRRHAKRQVKETSAEWLETLKIRLAKGEITEEQYEELKKLLKET